MSIRAPIKFERVAAAFDEFSRDWRPCDSSSSGSEHYWSSGTANSLSDLVNSFIESGSSDSDRYHHEDPEGIITSTIGNDDDDDDYDQEVNGRRKLGNIVNGKLEREREELLNRLMSGDVDGDDENGHRLKAIVAEETAAIEDSTMDEANITSKRRRLMARLRQRGYDAGVCKSRWEKTSRHPAGKYEYIDVLLPPSIPKSSSSSGRYIVEVYPAAHFEVAGPTDHYSALLAALPAVFVGRAEDLKQTVRLMSVAMKESLKTRGLPVAPWRTRGYLVAKWFAPYKRTTNAAPTSSSSSSYDDDANARKVVLGFDKKQQVQVQVQGSTYNYCRSAQFSGKRPAAPPPLGVRIGLLTAAFQGKS